MSWAYKSHRGQINNVPKKPADPWLYMGDGMYMKYTQFIQRRKDNNAS